MTEEKTVTIQFPGGGSAVELIDCARRLAADIERIIADGPTARELGAAPVLDQWRRAERPTSSLVGIVCGHHPRDWRPTMTSALFAIDPDMGWARTWSRLYTLGRPANSTDGRGQ